jgi:hypothetical protein
VAISLIEFFFNNWHNIFATCLFLEKLLQIGQSMSFRSFCLSKHKNNVVLPQKMQYPGLCWSMFLSTFMAIIGNSREIKEYALYSYLIVLYFCFFLRDLDAFFGDSSVLRYVSIWD